MRVLDGIASKLAVTLAGIGFASLINNTLQSADELGKLSTRLGESVENLSRLQYAARLTGVTTQTLNLGLQRMTRRVSEAAQGTGEAVGALQELNLSAEALNQLSPSQQFKALADALQDVENPADKVRLSMKLLDSEGVALIQTMEGGADAIERLGRESDETGNTISGEFAQKAAQANDALTKLSATGQGLLNEVVIKMAPLLEETAGYISDNFDEIVAITGAIATLTVGIKAARLAQIAFNTAVRANPYFLVASLIGTATAALIGYQSATEDSISLTDRMAESNKRLKETIEGLTEADLERNKVFATNKLADEKAKLAELKQELQSLSDTQERLNNSNAGRSFPNVEDINVGRVKELKQEIKFTEEAVTDLENTLTLVNNSLGETASSSNKSKIFDQDEIKAALSALQSLRQGYDESGLAREKYLEQQEQLNLLLESGRISEVQYSAALSEAAKQRDDVIYSITEAKGAYESLRQEFDKFGIAQETVNKKEEQLNTLRDRGIINAEQYSLAIERVREEYKKTLTEIDPVLKAQDELTKKYADNSRLLGALRQQQAGSLYAGPAQDAVQLDTQLNSANEAISGLGTPEYNGNDLEATAAGMFDYEMQYKIRLEQLKEFEKEKYGVQQEAAFAREALEKSHEAKMQKYREDMLNAQFASTANMFGSLLSVSSQYFGESSALTKSFMIFQKAAQIGQSIMAINTGIAQASALPFPANIPAIASVVSATAGIVSSIASVSAPAAPSFSANPNFAGEYASGGLIPRGKFGLVGETGEPELVSGPANVTGVKETRKLLQGSGGTSVNVTVNYYSKDGGNKEDGQKQGRQIADLVEAQVMQIIQREKRPGGNLYK